MLSGTRLWAETRAISATVGTTIEAAAGFDELAELLSGHGVRRVVATGNGAAYYVTLTLWLVSLGSGRGPDVVALPAGALAGVRWRSGDRLLVVSSSGELRDVVEALESVPQPFGLITASARSTIASAAGACALVEVEGQDAITHTQAYTGNVAAALSVWSQLAGDTKLADGVRAVPEALAAAVDEAERWVGGLELTGLPAAASVFGTGPAWAAALEAALLLKEIARLPAEGAETREGATSSMYALAPGQLAVSLPAGPEPDSALREAEQVCAGTGARVVRAPGGLGRDARLAALTTFPASVALAAVLGRLGGHDVDRPSWADAYYATARVDPSSRPPRAKE
jgi:fructoselysine-6-P-deglycase FrlB-like protein